MRVFTHFRSTGIPDAASGIRYCTILQFGDDWDLIGSAIMKNPGSARAADGTMQPVTDPVLLSGLSGHDGYPGEDWYEFGPDMTMQCVGEIFEGYRAFHGDDAPLSGVIRIFNLFYPRNPDLKEALRHFDPEKDMVDDIPQIRESLGKPVYIGWGDLYRNRLFRERTLEIFGIVAPANPYLNPDIRSNRFVHPASIQRYAKNSEGSRIERERFFRGHYDI